MRIIFNFEIENAWLEPLAINILITNRALINIKVLTIIIVNCY